MESISPELNISNESISNATYCEHGLIYRLCFAYYVLYILKKSGWQINAAFNSLKIKRF